LISAEEYERLARRDRRVYRAHKAPDELINAIAATEPPPEADEVETQLRESTR